MRGGESSVGVDQIAQRIVALGVLDHRSDAVLFGRADDRYPGEDIEQCFGCGLLLLRGRGASSLSAMRHRGFRRPRGREGPGLSQARS